TGAPCVEWSPDRKTEDPETWREERDGPSEIGIRQVDDCRPAFDITSARGAARGGARLGDGDRRIRSGYWSGDRRDTLGNSRRCARADRTRRTACRHLS